MRSNLGRDFPFQHRLFEVKEFRSLASLLLHKWKTCHVLEDLQVRVPLLRMTPPARTNRDFGGGCGSEAVHLSLQKNSRFCWLRALHSLRRSRNQKEFLWSQGSRWRKTIEMKIFVQKSFERFDLETKIERGVLRSSGVFYMLLKQITNLPSTQPI